MSMKTNMSVIRTHSQPWMLTLLLVVVSLVLLEALTATGRIEAVLISRPTTIFSELFVSLRGESLQGHILVSTYRVALTFIIGLVLATVLSLLCWRYNLLRQTYISLLGALFGTPLVLLYLIFVVIFGRGTGAIVAIAVPIGTIPIVVNSTDALVSVNRNYVQVSRSFNASKRQILQKVIIPAAAPGIFSGVRIGFSYMITVVIAVEFLLVTDGLGGMISDSYFRFNTTDMYVGITLIILLVVIAIFLIRRMEEMIQR